MVETTSGEWRLRPVLAAIVSSGKPVRLEHEAGSAPVQAATFVTISREAGAGGTTLAHRLVEALNRVVPDERPWEAFDRELVEKVARDHHLSASLVETLVDSGHSWLRDALAGLPSDGAEASEFNLYRRVAQTIRALAQAGRVVIVGRGGVYVTHHMPGGIHVRLVAPFEHRVANMARLLNLDAAAAAEHVRRIDRNRASFYGHYWPRQHPSADAFTLTLNTAQLTDELMVELLTAAVLPRAGRAEPLRATGRA